MINLLEVNEEYDKPGGKEWYGIVLAWRKAKPIDKQVVIKLLRSGAPVPSYAAEFLADTLDDDVKFEFKRGNKPWYPGNPSHRADFIVRFIHQFEAWIENPGLLEADTDNEFRKVIMDYNRLAKSPPEHRITANKSAVLLVAEHMGLSETKVREKITEFNKGIKRFAEKHGCSIASAEDYFLN